MKHTKRQGRPPTMDNPRGRILDEAAELFARDGYDGASLADLANAVGVTKAAIYHYFPNKKEIFESIIVQTLEGLLQCVSQKISDKIEADDALYCFMTAHAEYFEEHYYNFVTMLVGFGGMQNEVKIHEAQRLRGAYERVLQGIIERGIASGTFRSANVSVSSRAALSMLNWMVRWFKPGQERTAASFAAEYCDIILHGLRADNQGKDMPRPSKSGPP